MEFNRAADLQAPMLAQDSEAQRPPPRGLDGKPRHPSGSRQSRSHSVPHLPRLKDDSIFAPDENEENQVGDEDPDAASRLLHLHTPAHDPRQRRKGQYSKTMHTSTSMTSMGGQKNEDPEFNDLDQTSTDLEAEALQMEDPPGDSSVATTVMLLLKCFLGTGVLFLPDGFRKSGIIPASLMIIGSGALATHCMFLLLDTKDFLRRERGVKTQSYGEIGEAALGKTGKRMVDAAVILSQTGFCAVYVSFVGNNMSKVYSFGLGRDSTMAHIAWMSFAQFFFMFLVWIRKLSLFKTTNSISLNIIFGSIGIIFACSTYQITSQGASPDASWGVNKDILTFFGTAVYAFEGIALVLPAEREMEDKTMMKPVIKGSMLLLVFLFVVLAAMAYLAFGDGTKVIVLQNVKELSDKSAWSAFEKCVLTAYCFAIIFTYPLQLVPPCRISERKFFPSGEGMSDEGANTLLWKKNAWRSLLTFIIYFVAAATSKQLDNLVSIIGSIACVPLAYTFPALFHLLVVDRDSISDKCIIVFGMLGAIVSLIAALASWANDPLEV